MKYSGNSTSNLIRHLKDKHGKAPTEAGSRRQPQLTELGFTSGSTQRYSPSSTKKKNLDRQVALFIAKDMRPVNVIAGEGFRDLVKALDPKYEVRLYRIINFKEALDLRN